VRRTDAKVNMYPTVITNNDHHHHVRLLRVVIHNRTYRNIKVPKASDCQLLVKVNIAERRRIYTYCITVNILCM